ncbi:MAG TPA: alkaline phosphatase family protein [Gemmatimonadaceae bacterium]|nr:alkaline phosphatase family protein [Gemmatimonadaceae bacterium]
MSTALSALILTILGAACAPRAVSSPPGSLSAAERPALAVMVVVDQFREPYLERYGDLFTGGLRRLLDKGRVYTNATHDHAITETAPGHATLSTGVYPMRHGIVANEWAERTPAGWLEVSNVGDSTVRIVGQPDQSGVSPRSLLRSGLADWMVAADPRSQVASVSGKDRGAVLPAAHAKGQVYWFNSAKGRFVTSTYYRDSYPAWAEGFTTTVLPKYLRDSTWANQTPVAALARTMPDTQPYEGNSVNTFFPHRYSVEGQPGRFWDWLASTPMLDAITLDFAETMVRSMALGRDDAPDFLNVSLSQADRIGHAYGPLSREQLDNLLRLDRELGEFFTFLDQTVGAGRWTVALSADHGVLSAPETLPQPGEPAVGHRTTAVENAALDSIFADARRTANDPTTPEEVAAALERLPIVADAYTHAQLLRGTPSDSFAVLVRRSLYPGRAAAEVSKYGVEVRFAPGLLSGPRGTSHGTPYWYDRHVPMIFMGAGIKAGRDDTRASTTDFAPTLARLLRVRAPSDLDGRALSGVAGR